MSDGRHSTREQYGRALAAESYPKTEAVSYSQELFLRKWVLSLGIDLPDDDGIEVVVKSLDVNARREIINALGIRAFDQKMVTVSAIRLGDRHLVLEMICPARRRRWETLL